jgi:hypothetical protein
MAINRYDFSSTYLNGTETGSRTHTGWKGRFGGSALVPFGNRFYARGSADLTHSLKGGDADAHGRFSLGIAYTF